jgi:hypothetical protein
MYQLKGFASIETLVSNVSGVVAPIGELSIYSATFSKDKKVYPSNLNSYITIYTFSSTSDVTEEIDPVPSIVSIGHSILDWVYTRQLASTTIENTQQFLLSLATNFAEECDSMECGSLVNASNGKQFPEWISWKTRSYLDEDNITTIWLSDQSFRQKYDNYEIVVVPPIENIDSFFSTAANVQMLVSNVTHSERFNYIQVARGDDPETALVGVSFNWVDPVNGANLINTNWSILVYGLNGNDNDVIREAIAAYILNNTNRSESEWRAIFPDIFKRTEFIFFPRWHNYAIPNMVLQSGIYSPVIYADKEIDYLKSILTPETGYAGSFVQSHASIMPHPYKSLALLVIGGYENRENLFDITQIYPDIINVSSTSVDYNRMSSQTQGLLTRLTQMILIAENLTYNADIPIGYRKVQRYGIVFISTRYMNIELLVSSKLTTPLYD